MFQYYFLIIVTARYAYVLMYIHNIGICELKSKVVFQNKGQVSSESDIVFNSKIRLVSEGLASFYEKMLTERTSKENTLIIVNYILRLKTEINLSLNYKRMNITVLV